MVKIYVASFNRATDGAISKLVKKMKQEYMWIDDYKKADYILAVADRIETFDFVLERFRENKKIIHLWAGEISQGTHDEVYRHAMTLMSDFQICTNKKAAVRVRRLCKSVDKSHRAFIVGNVMLDNLGMDESLVPSHKYDLVLYNPPTLLSEAEVLIELDKIKELVRNHKFIWIEPNGDKYSDLVTNLKVTIATLPRSKFLGLLKNCNRFITNSSCQYYEAPFLLKPEQIISIGERNVERESKYADMTIPNASENIMSIFRMLENKCRNEN